MKPDVEYPYMPEGRKLKYVLSSHPMMQEAAKARAECAGDPIQPVGAVMVRDGRVIARAGNGYNLGSGNIHVCPRVVLGCPSGTGYELCDLHDSPGHSEPMVVKAARDGGVEARGADVYMYGHWWACEPCWKTLIDAGIRDLYVTEDAHEKFTRERVMEETMKPSVKSVYIASALSHIPANDRNRYKAFLEKLGMVCEAAGADVYMPHKHSDPENDTVTDPSKIYEMGAEQSCGRDVTVAEVTYPSLGAGGEIVIAHNCGKRVVLMSKKDVRVSRFVKGNPAVVYHIEYENEEEACKMLKNVLKQL